MPMVVQQHYDHLRYVLDPQRDGADEWNQAACTFLRNFVNFNPSCPWDNDEKATIGAELLGVGMPLQNWIAKWRGSGVSLVWFKMPLFEEWNLEIGAYAGGGATATEYRVLDVRNGALGVSDAGDLTTIVAGRAAPAVAPQAGGRSPAPGAAPQNAKLVSPPATQQQVAKMVGDADSQVRIAAQRVEEVLKRLAALAARVQLQNGVNNTRAALDELVKVAATVGAR